MSSRPLQLSRSMVIQLTGDAQSDFHGLLVVQARVNLGLVRSGEIRLPQAARATHAFGDVFAGEFQVDAAENGACITMDSKRRLQFRDDIVETTSLVALPG